MNDNDRSVRRSKPRWDSEIEEIPRTNAYEMDQMLPLLQILSRQIATQPTPATHSPYYPVQNPALSAPTTVSHPTSYSHFAPPALHYNSLHAQAMPNPPAPTLLNQTADPTPSVNEIDFKTKTNDKAEKIHIADPVSRNKEWENI